MWSLPHSVALLSTGEALEYGPAGVHLFIATHGLIVPLGSARTTERCWFRLGPATSRKTCMSICLPVSASRSLWFFAAVSLLGACAEGGTERRITGDTTVASSHAMFGVVGVTAFQRFPVLSNQVARFDGLIELDEIGDFAIRSNGAAIANGEYALQFDGAFTILIPQTNRPSLAWEGGFGLEGDTGRLFLTDRFGNVGLYLATRNVAGTTDPDRYVDDYTLLSMQVQFADDANPPNPATPADVGRAAFGLLTLSQTMTGVDPTIAGQLLRSTDPAARLNANGGLTTRTNNEFELAVDYGGTGTLGETRIWSSAGDPDLIFGSETGQATSPEQPVNGLVALVRKADAALVPSNLEGDWIVGIWTIFVSPTRSGVDIALGAATITDNGDGTGELTIAARNNTNTPFVFTGDFTPRTDDPMDPTSANGQFTYVEERFGETWYGAAVPGNETVILVDPAVETRVVGESPELNFIVLVRRDRN